MRYLSRRYLPFVAGFLSPGIAPKRQFRMDNKHTERFHQEKALFLKLEAEKIILCKWGGVKPPLPQHDDCAMALRPRNAVVEQSSQMFWAACGRMWPEHDDVRKLSVFGALDRHGKMTALLPETQTGAVSNRITDKFRYLLGGKIGVSVRSAHTIHPANGLCNGSMSRMRREKHL